MRGKVLVACDSFGVLMRQPCEDDLSRALAARGSSPIVAALTSAPTPAEYEAQLGTRAAAAGADFVFVLSLMPAATSTGGSGISVGIGGFSLGRKGRAPDRPAVTYVRDAPCGRKANGPPAASDSWPPASDIGGQVRQLTGSVLDSAQAAGLF